MNTTKPKNIIKRVLRYIRSAVPVSMRQRMLDVLFSDSEQFQLGVPTMLGMLKQLEQSGFKPNTVIDVGANVGGWSLTAASVYQGSRFIMIDGNVDNEGYLQRTRAALGCSSEYSITLLGSLERDRSTFYKMGTGSSVLPEMTSFDRTEVSLPMRTLDAFMAGRPYTLPVLLKLDVQGYELEVLRGGRSTLAQSDVVILETSLLPYNEGAPLLGDVITFMGDAGFATFDCCGQARRQTDHVLFQADLVFVKAESRLRVPRKFWVGEPDRSE